MKGTLAILYKLLTVSATVVALTTVVMASDVQGAVEKAKDGKRLANAVVYISSVSGTFKPPAKPVVINQKGKKFIPRVVAVMKGTTVRFLNSDPDLHNVYANSRASKFNVSQSEKGKHSDVKFTKFGVIPIRCHIHAKMKAYVAVLSNPYFAVTNNKGLFKIPKVPPGTYTLKVWSESGTTSQSVTVKASGNTTALLKVK